MRLPGDKCLVVDAKAPMTAFLAAQADGIDAAERDRLLSAHATSLRSHVDALAAKAYWSAFTTTPEMVVCFVPGDSILAAALSAEPGLFDHAMSRRVVLASPGTLLALLRTVAFTWQQDALTGSARQLLELGQRAATPGSARSAAHAHQDGRVAAAVGRELQRAGRRAGVTGAGHRPQDARPRPGRERLPEVRPIEQGPGR